MSGGSMPIVADNIDTLILNVKLRQDFPVELAQQLDVLKEASQDAEEDLVTDFTFAGERLFIKPHGAGKQWRWILHSPSLHLDVGLGKHTQIVAKARLSAAYLWATEIGDALTQVYAFLTSLLGSEPFLQVSEAHLCVDVAGWELAVGDAAAFVTRGHRRGLRLEDEDETPPALADQPEWPAMRHTGLQQRGGALLLHLRQDQGDHRLAQGLDAGGLETQRLGR